MKDLTAGEIATRLRRKVQVNNEAFASIMASTYRRIDTAVRFGAVYCTFNVPEIVVGYPMYNLNECIVHVMSKLQKNGFKVHYLFPAVLVITWVDAVKRAESGRGRPPKTLALRS